MSESTPESPETGQEAIPTVEEVHAVFAEILEGAVSETVRQLEDEQGLYLWDIKVPSTDGYAEYSYMREGRYPQGQAKSTAIHVTFFDNDDFPAGGRSVAKWRNGKWEMTP